MRGNEGLFALTCALTSLVGALAVQVFANGIASSALSYSIVIVGLGGALVIIRYDRLGPFEGEFGPPRAEARIRDRIADEAARSNRYNREFSVVAVRQSADTRLDWSSMVREVDQVVSCRNDVKLLILPETTRAGSLRLLHRAGQATSSRIQAVLVSFPSDGRHGDELAQTLLRLFRETARPGQVVLRDHGTVQTLPIVI